MESNASNSVTPQWPYSWISNAEQLNRAAEQISREQLISVDTETVGWETGNERLCLVQIGVSSKSEVILIDVLACGDLKPLEPALSSLSPTVIAHNASFEERQFGRYGIKLRGVRDTLQLARKLRPDLPNHTLQTCCRFLLGLDLSKAEQASDWSLRPLSDQQIDYARLDAEVTLKLYDVLAQIEDRLAIDPRLGVPQLMEQLAQTSFERMQLTKSIAADLAFLQAREMMIRETIRSRLVAGDSPYQGEFGKCRIARIKKTEVNPQKVKEQFPELAEQAVTEHVERARLLALMKEHGRDPKELESVLDIIGYNDRLYISIGTISEEEG